MPIDQLFSFSAAVIALIPATTGIVEVAKRLGLDSKYAPAISILIGVGLMFLTAVVWQAAIAQGIIVGLAASGLYSGSAKTGTAIREAMDKK